MYVPLKLNIFNFFSIPISSDLRFFAALLNEDLKGKKMNLVGFGPISAHAIYINSDLFEYSKWRLTLG